MMIVSPSMVIIHLYIYIYILCIYIFTADFETTCTPVPSLCRFHHELYSRSTSNEQHRRIVEDCKSASHTPDLTLSCPSCYMKKVRRRTKILKKCKDKKCQKIQEKCCKKCETDLMTLNSIMDHLVRCRTKNCGRCLRYQKHDKDLQQCNHSNTERISRLDPIHYTIICYDNALDRIHADHSYTGYDCIDVMLAWLRDLEPKLIDTIDDIVEIDRNTISEEDVTKMENYNMNMGKIECYACGRTYEKKQKYIHLDHCHGSGRFRGEATNNNINIATSVYIIIISGFSCRSCNRRMHEKKTFKIFIHNLENFDSHLIAGGYSEDFLNLEIESRIWNYDEETGERILDSFTGSEEEEEEEKACEASCAAATNLGEKYKHARVNSTAVNKSGDDVNNEESDCTADDDDENIFDEAVDGQEAIDKEIKSREEFEMMSRMVYNVDDIHMEMIVEKSKYNWRLSAVPSNSQKLKMIKISRFQFADSLSFQMESLDALSAKLIKEKKAVGEELEILKTIPQLCWSDGELDREKYDVCLGKQHFPYQMVTTIEDAANITTFPTHEEWEQKNGEPIEVDDYDRAARAYRLWGCRTLLQFYEKYCHLDSALLCEVMTGFKNRAMANLNLSITKYFTLPSFALGM